MLSNYKRRQWELSTLDLMTNIHQQSLYSTYTIFWWNFQSSKMYSSFKCPQQWRVPEALQEFFKNMTN